jgi:hypothetical protein
MQKDGESKDSPLQLPTKSPHLRANQEIGEAALRTVPALSIGTVTFPKQRSYTLFAVPFTEE